MQRLFGGLVCAPANDAQILAVATGNWTDGYGRPIRSAAQLIYDPHLGVVAPGALNLMIQDLSNGYPLINAALGHATVVTAITFLNTMTGPMVQSVVVRDPWPYNPNKRNLTAQELFGAAFVMRVAVEPA